ncbi:cyclic nucleotide-binding protein [Gottschalkia acidurici 9a]|uniref:Cyclic nucleotide-binding protein n=1 Tax=Gottschalkia acidurici (strain ATCC 7906 / DSM 604 / BCRC 14475 / CIP 104303 / KCTC 5404 / NCIMB 10678 / 9a) TaxID=1128398 RepID=K0AW15_GOTA9|nr:Crp/Fnr family transcriptional regulator [Gottschalkia acidurici]AFS77434.1 cyclic nucleotide-binding protein [Gottschalkia acidurici 9a]
MLNILKECSLFKGQALSHIEHLLGSINYRVEHFKENEIVFSYEKIADTIGIILSGSIDVQKIFPCGKVVTVTTRTAPDLIANASMFSKIEYYPSNISACSPSDILLIHKNELLKLFLIDKRIMINFLESVSNRILELNKKIEILSLNSIKEKIAFFLINECEKNNSNKITLSFSKKSWSEHMNVSRSSLSRELRDLSDKGILTFDKRTIIIKDLEELNLILYES